VAVRSRKLSFCEGLPAGDAPMQQLAGDLAICIGLG
jgi:hypothetical protein